LGVLSAVVLLDSHSTGQIGVLPKGDVRLRAVTDPKYSVGDVWEYKTRAGEEHSRLTVLKIERSSKLGIIVHVAVDNLTWRTCQGYPFPEAVPHMPFARKAVDASVTRRVAMGHSLPDYQDGYETWRRGYSQGHAGVYIIPVGDAISVAEEIWRKGMGCGSRERVASL
jgi:hypothetical protein